MTNIVAIDPGYEQTAWIHYDAIARRVLAFGIDENPVMLQLLRWIGSDRLIAPDLAYEMVACYGMAVGKEVFETVLWTGRFIQACPFKTIRVYRRDVKMHLCGNNGAKDSNIRQALIDRFGPGEEKAIGKKKSPGPLYGISKDVWSALAIAVTCAEVNAQQHLAAACAGGTK